MAIPCGGSPDSENTENFVVHHSGMGEMAKRIHDLAMDILTAREPVRIWPLLMERLTADLPGDLAVLIDLDWEAGTGRALTGAPDWLHEAPLDALLNSHMRVHPLLRHYAQTTDRTPLTLDDVVSDDWWDSEAYWAGREAIGIDRQIALPLRSEPGRFRGVIMSREGTGYAPADREYAALARSLLDTVAVHASLMRNPDLDITPRETAVLVLLAEGLTAHAIGSRLGIKERTVVKHKENLYRKLSANDRVTAIRKARRLGLLREPPDSG
ncbi:helix-turn-helix transcriptional regulator [Herbidospora cretacea]|uniref:helix-turn-helix transcriptional regulator n=1 Tax=Herbidospora cretacea TaxID=28444 RepID=UPI0012DF823F|nr:LuxR C-terminal-related transcriptional regulator [Herbidospora cretacea]